MTKLTSPVLADLEQQMAVLQEKLDSLEKEACIERARLFEEHYDIHIGDMVEPGSRDDDGRLCRQYKVTKIVGDRYGAQLYGLLKKKDGTFGTREIAIWRNWRKI